MRALLCVRKRVSSERRKSRLTLLQQGGATFVVQAPHWERTRRHGRSITSSGSYSSSGLAGSSSRFSSVSAVGTGARDSRAHASGRVPLSRLGRGYLSGYDHHLDAGAGEPAA